MAVGLFAVLVLGTGPARADNYDPERAGHPVRILAYALHPVGVILDYALLRPAHWLVHHEPMRILLGHERTAEERYEQRTEPDPSP